MNCLLSRSVSPLLLLFALCGAVLMSCGGSKEAAESISTEQHYKMGMAALEDEDYEKAKEQFEVILLQDPASEFADDAQFYLGETHYRNKEYRLAAFHYSRVLKDFPSSPYYKRALFLTGECYAEVSAQYEREQTQTENAITQYRAFVQFFPGDSLTQVAQGRIVDLRTKLAHRDYSVATHYLDRDEYKAAELYFQRVIDRYPETEYYAKALEGREEVRRHLGTTAQEEKSLSKQ